MPTVANANSATKDEIRAVVGAMVPNNGTGGTKLNAMESESSGLALADFKHLLRWRGPSSAGRGDPVILPSYGTFTASWTESGTYSSGSAVITGIADTVRMQPGQQFTATGFTGTQTVVSVDSATQITASSNATGGGGATTLTFTAQPHFDPVMRIGVNCGPGGSEIIARQGYVTTNHEGHYQGDSDDVPSMEWYPEFFISGATGSHRPFFGGYDKILKKPLSTYIITGRDKIIGIQFANYGGDTGGSDAYTLEENIFTMRRAPHQTGEDVVVRIDSNTAKNSELQMSANGDAIGSPTLRVIVGFAGASSQHRNIQFGVRSNGSASLKTGSFWLRADDTANYNSVLASLGGTVFNDALWHITGANIPESLPVEIITSGRNASATLLRHAWRVETQNSAGTAGAIAVDQNARLIIGLSPLPTQIEPAANTVALFLDSDGSLKYRTSGGVTRTLSFT